MLKELLLVLLLHLLEKLLLNVGVLKYGGSFHVQALVHNRLLRLMSCDRAMRLDVRLCEHRLLLATRNAFWLNVSLRKGGMDPVQHL